MEGSVSQVLSPDREQIAVAPTFGPVLIFSAGKGLLLSAKTRPTERSYSLAWCPKGNGFFYGDPAGTNETSTVFFGGDGKEKKLPGGVHQTAVSPNGRWIASIDHNTLGILNLDTERLETSKVRDNLPIREVRGVVWQDDNILLVMQGGWGGGIPFAITSYDMAHNKVLSRIELAEGQVTASWTLDKPRQRLWIGTDAGHLLEIDLSGKRVVAERELATIAIIALAVAEDGYLAAWVGERVLLINTQVPAEQPRNIPAWSTNSGHGWRPLLAWINGDLLMAGALHADRQWLAERREKVIAALDEAPEEQQKRFRTWSEKAAQGDVEAQFTLGSLYAQGKGVAPDMTQAVNWWLKAAEAGNINAQVQLGQTYARGRDVAMDRAKARFWWLKAADQCRALVEERGDRTAASRLAQMYGSGMGVHEDPVLATVLLQIAMKGTQTKLDQEDLGLAGKLEHRLHPEQKDRVKAVLAEWRPGKPLPRDMREAICGVSKYVQEGFDRNTALAELRNFQQRLRHDVDDFASMDITAENDGGIPNAEWLRKAFPNSIARGPKGDALRISFAQPSPRRIISPLQVFLTATQNTACPVGFGGKFKDDGRDVELWYVDLNPGDEGALGAFEGAGLPPYASLQRDRFPALVLERDAKGRLMWYSVSREMSAIMQYWFHLQIQ